MLVALGKNDGQGEGRGMAEKGRRMLNCGEGCADWGVGVWGGDTDAEGMWLRGGRVVRTGMRREVTVRKCGKSTYKW